MVSVPARTAIWSLVVLGFFLDLLVPLILGNFYPGYSQLLHTVSELGSAASPVQLWECLALIGEGVALIVLVIVLMRCFPTNHWAQKWFYVSIVVFGIGSIIAGVFPEDTMGAPETISGKLHGIASGIGFLFYLILPAFALIWLRGDAVVRVGLVVTLAISVASFVLFFAADAAAEIPWSYVGLWQRIFLANGYLVLSLVVWQLTHHRDVDVDVSG